jgi:hypothetical protein
MKLAVLLFLSAMLFTTHASAAPADHDSRPLTPAETAIFMPLACAPAAHPYDGRTCRTLIGYHGGIQDGHGETLDFDAIAYGSFTAVGRDEAYLSYLSSVEPHATNFGGGILFRQVAGKWQMVRWYPGEQSVGCIRLPGKGRQKMLCSFLHVGGGAAESSLWVRVVRKNSTYEQRILNAIEPDDGSVGGFELDGSPYDYYCGLRKNQNEPFLVSVENLHRSADPRYLADAVITYLPAASINQACEKMPKRLVPVLERTVHFQVENGAVKAVPTVKYMSFD